MSRYRAVVVPLVLVTLLILTVGAAAAKGGGGGQAKAKPAKARITWSQAHLVQTIASGQTTVVQVTLTSSSDLANVTLRVPGGLGRIVKVEPASFTSLKAGVATPIKLTISMPSQNAHSQAGVVQVRAGKRAIPTPLKLKLTVPAPANAAEDVH
jgi:uncharacterized membrane protein